MLTSCPYVVIGFSENMRSKFYYPLLFLAKNERRNKYTQFISWMELDRIVKIILQKLLVYRKVDENGPTTYVCSFVKTRNSPDTLLMEEIVVHFLLAISRDL